MPESCSTAELVEVNHDVGHRAIQKFDLGAVLLPYAAEAPHLNWA